MPVPGDQHKGLGPNPFDDEKPQPGNFSPTECTTLQSRLEKHLGPEYISTRPGPGGTKLSYLEAYNSINLANQVFGFNGWSSSVKETVIDFVDVHSSGKVDLGIAVIVRVTLKDGTFHEDVGFGHVENAKTKAAAFEKGRKSAVTDGLKRALRNFGNLLGNCLYSKDYLSKISKVKFEPKKLDVENLHRHGDNMQIKKEPLEPVSRVSSEERRGSAGDDEFGSDFDEADWSVMDGINPDASAPELPPPVPRLSHQQSPVKNDTIHGGRRASNGPNGQQDLRPSHPRGPLLPPPGQKAQVQNGPNSRPPVQQASNIGRAQPPNLAIPSTSAVQAPRNPMPQNRAPQQGPPQPRPHVGGPNHYQPPQNQHQNNIPRDNSSAPTSAAVEGEAPIGFFTARAAEILQSATSTKVEITKFNPHLDSPSIKKTAGVDHTKSAAVSRDKIQAPPSSSQVNLSRPSFNTPQSDQVRRIGMPSNMPSPLQNRNQYKPPQLKRPLESPYSTTRPALSDLTNGSINVPLDSNVDPKRQKLTAGDGARYDGNQNSIPG